jgi:hypothetical protein
LRIRLTVCLGLRTTSDGDGDGDVDGGGHSIVVPLNQIKSCCSETGSSSQTQPLLAHPSPARQAPTSRKYGVPPPATGHPRLGIWSGFKGDESEQTRTLAEFTK